MNKSILVIDDEITMTTLLDFFLSDQYCITVKNSGDDAFNWLNVNTTDLIISDIQMNGMDGFTLLKKIKSIDRLKNIPVIMLSGHSDEKERNEAINFGAHGYLTKPFMPEDLKITVEKFINDSNKVST